MGRSASAGQTNTVWFAEITEATEDPINGIAAWLTSYGWVVEEIDLRK